MIVVDLQDVGARFYTYATTVGYLLEAAARNRKKVLVLDRPNPLGRAYAGPLLDPGISTFIAYHSVPIQHGLTIGELAQLLNLERNIGAELEVVRMSGWRAGDLFDDTKLPWTAPSPNLRDAHAALLYPGLGMLEMTALSVGRGTDRPFHQFGAPWLDHVSLVRALQQRELSGVELTATTFTPKENRFAGQLVNGVHIKVVAPHKVRPIRLGLVIATELVKLHANELQLHRAMTSIGNRSVIDALRRGDSVTEIEARWHDQHEQYELRRASALLY